MRWYTDSHTWIGLRDDGRVGIGLSVYVQQELGEIVHVDLPLVGDRVEIGGVLVMLESRKAAIEIESPLAGKVVVVNDSIASRPQTLMCGEEICLVELQVDHDVLNKQIPQWLTAQAYRDLCCPAERTDSSVHEV